jgi:pre-mRNA cleavage complex 2 protein Pcf11
MKARHMDWHFKVKDPDVAKRGVHRDWYIGEREWIEFREQDEAAPAPTANGTTNGGPVVAKKEAKDQYIHVPTDAALVHAPCPICQEKFEPQWLVEANDFVWMDAIKVNEKIYHATCWEEYSKGSSLGGGGGGRGTPDSVLGKRKAEVSSDGFLKKARSDL